MCSSSLTKRDEEIIRALQEDFPLCEEPYKVLAERAGVSEEEFLSRVQDFIAENSYLPMRTLYGNMCWTDPVSISDVKIKQHEDMPLGWEKLQWISVYDNVIGNRKYPYLYGILYPLHVKHCRYEQFGRRDYER